MRYRESDTNYWSWCKRYFILNTQLSPGWPQRGLWGALRDSSQKFGGFTSTSLTSLGDTLTA